MGLDERGRRRWVGAAALAAALLMLIAGQTLLQRTLAGAGFLLYWLACLVLTTLAIVVALADVRASRISIRKEQRELLDNTIKQIQEEARERKRKGAKPNRPR